MAFVKVYNEVKNRLINAYKQVSDKIGNPLDANNLIGPLIDKTSVKAFTNAIDEVQKEGGKILFGGTLLEGEKFISGNYVVPALVEVENNYKIVQAETFAPILYMIKYKTIEDAIALNNEVPQGLSSSIFSINIREAGKFLSESGSDCGIANVNCGTSGAEIGGAFGGEKKLAVAENLAPTLGNNTCVVRPILLTIVMNCLWHKVSNLIFNIYSRIV